MASVTTAAAATSGHQVESWTTNCAHPYCSLGDFLPFRCTHCGRSYCSSHRTPESHDCSAYDATAYDVRAATCPLCGEVLPVVEVGGRNADVNAAMELHLNRGRCRGFPSPGSQSSNGNNDGPAKTLSSAAMVANGSSASSSSNNNNNNKGGKGQYQCRYGRCSNRNWADIHCDKCGKGFCPTHRDPKHHKCSSTLGATTATPTKAAGSDDSRRRNDNNATSRISQGVSRLSLARAGPSATSSAAAAAADKATTLSSANIGPGHPKLPSKDRQPSLGHVQAGPSSKTASGTNDRSASKRAAKERESAAIALKKRAEKGLLSEDEKVRYATLQALEAKAGKDKNKDCCIS